MGKILLLLVVIGSSGCAASLVVQTQCGQKCTGVPVRTPVLVRVTKTTSYRPLPRFANDPETSKLCGIPQRIEEFRALPAGEIYYVGMDSAPFGKSEFKVEFSDLGVLTAVSLNSDPSATVEATAQLLGEILPYAAEKKADEMAAAAVSATDERSEKCLLEAISYGQPVRVTLD